MLAPARDLQKEYYFTFLQNFGVEFCDVNALECYVVCWTSHSWHVQPVAFIFPSPL